MYLTSVEVNGAIVCACVMTLKPLVARFLPGLLGGLSRGGGDDFRKGSSGSDSNGRRGPPTIGSRPSKAPLSPADSEMMGKFGGGDEGGGGGSSSSRPEWVVGRS